MVCTPIAEVREPSLKSWVSSPTIPSSPPSSATTSLVSVTPLTTKKKQRINSRFGAVVTVDC